MRHFYKLPVNMPNIPLMTEIMRTRAELFDETGKSTGLPEDAKRIGLGILQMTNGRELHGAWLQWVAHDSKHTWDGGTIDRYIVVLNGQVMTMIDDECPAMNVSEVWWVDGKYSGILINKSGDDAVVLHVFVAV